MNHKVYEKIEVEEKSLEYFNDEELSSKVWIDKYCLKNNDGELLETTPLDTHKRMAKEFARIEGEYFKEKISDEDFKNLSEFRQKNRDLLSEEKIMEYFDNFKYIIPQGSVMASLGNDFNYSSLSNCVVVPEIYDSYGGIAYTDQQLAQLFKRRCVEENSNVVTNDGIKSIKDVKKGDYVLSYNTDKNKSEFKRVVDKFATDVDINDRIIITLSNGTKLKTSKKHPILTLKEKYEFVKSSNLYVGDICIKPEKNNVVDKKTTDSDIAWFIGAHLGDGTCGKIKSISKKSYGTYTYDKLRFRMLGDNEDVVKNYENILNNLTDCNFNYKKSTQKRYKTTVWESHNTSKKLVEVCEKYLDNQIGKKVYNAIVPSYIIKNNLWIPFIAGLIDTDGYIKEGGSLVLRICAKKVIDLVSIHLSSIGISYNVSIYEDKRKNCESIWILNIHSHEENFINDVKRYMKHNVKISKLESYNNKRPFSRKYYLTEGERNTILKNYDNQNNKKGNLSAVKHLLKNDKNCGIGTLNEFLKNDLINEKKYYEILQRLYIVNIEQDNESEKYVDIEVEDNNNFFAGNYGVINIHNCGVGTDISTLRPRHSSTNNSAGTSTGAISFMERFSNTTREVAQEGRRGALMISISVQHPDIEEFIDIKRDLTKVTGANISIKITDDFMNAVRNNEDYTLKFPIDSENPTTTKVIKAKELWDKIISAARDNAEPGVLFWDRQHWYSTSSVYQEYKNISVNPCAEIAMGHDSCRLIALNMFGCIVNPFTKDVYFDFDKWYEIVYYGQRLNDDLVDLELESVERILNKVDNDNEPDYIKDVEKRTWEKLYEVGKKGRRTGLGFTALGDVLAGLNLKYDTDEAIEMTEKIMKVKCEAEFDSSIDMAIERGGFKEFNPKIENTSEFVQMLKVELPDVYERMMKFGRRNVSLSTLAPTGSLSILAQTTSGIEPLFMVEPYERKKKVLGDEPYDKIDDVGDKWKVFKVYHPKLKMFLDINSDKTIEDSAYISAEDIDWKKRIEMQSVCQKFTTHSISSTLNLRTDVTEETVSDIYHYAWEMGLKGITIYRDGSRIGVLTKNEDNNPLSNPIFKDFNVPKRPKVLQADVMRFVNKGDKWIGFIGLKPDEGGEIRPHEIFTGLQEAFPVPYYVESGEIVKTKIDGVSRYDFVYKDKDGYPIIMTGLNRAFDREYWNLGKMISAILRHRMPLKSVVDLIDSLKFVDDHIVTWRGGIKRMIKKYIKADETFTSDEHCPECGSTQYVYEGGCEICKDCGYSKKC